MTADRTARIPKYRAVADSLRDRVEAGEWAPGERLPAESALVRAYGVSLATVRQGIAVLRQEGLLDARQGVGTFVRSSSSVRAGVRGLHAALPDTVAEVDHRDASRTARPLLVPEHAAHEVSVARRPPPERIRALLGEGGEVVVRRRVLRPAGGGDPVELAATHLPLDVAAGTYLEAPRTLPRALFLCLEEVTGRRPDRVRDRWGAATADEAEAAVLGLRPGDAVLRARRVTTDRAGAVLEVTEWTWPAAAVDLGEDWSPPR